jgi:hypothetical protein
MPVALSTCTPGVGAVDDVDVAAVVDLDVVGVSELGRLTKVSDIWYTGIHEGGRCGRQLLTAGLSLARTGVFEHVKGWGVLGSSTLAAC